MSNRAVEAYGDGERPKSKWTKAAILSAVERYCDEEDRLYPADELESMRKADLFDRFMEHTSWHHTSKFFNETDFYGLCGEAVCAACPPLSADETAARRAEERALADLVAAEERRRRKRGERLEGTKREFEDRFGFPSDSVAAFYLIHPAACDVRFSGKGTKVLEVLEGETQGSVYQFSRINTSHLRLFDAKMNPFAWEDIPASRGRALLDEIEEAGGYGVMVYRPLIPSAPSHTSPPPRR